MGRPKGSKDKKPRKRSGNYVRIPCMCCVCGAEFTYRKNVQNPKKKCKACLGKERVKRFQDTNPRGYNKKESRADTLRRGYGLSVGQYDEMLEQQGGKCAICGGDQHPVDHQMCVDHDHLTGRVRGLLCHNCNRGIGVFKDNTLFATRYLMGYAQLSWDEYFLSIAVLVSSRSKDRSTKVGAVIVRDRVIISTGYNGFPRGMDDNVEERHDRPLKYLYTSHAEENAIFNAARIGAQVEGGDIYVTMHPCTKCTRAIIQSQIKRVFIMGGFVPDRWREDFLISDEMFAETEIEVVTLTTAGGPARLVIKGESWKSPFLPPGA